MNYQLLISAFALGILGSFHCIGMCGPLALSLPINTENYFQKVYGVLIYNLGRVFTYSLFGAFLGIIGESFSFFGWQQKLSIILGLLIIFVVIFSKKINQISSTHFFLNSFLGNIRYQLSLLFNSKKTSSLFFIGLLNGLLPCGLVYIAAAGSIAAGNIFSGILFMIFFGLGTVPVMWSVAFFGSWLNVKFRQQIRKSFPIVMLLIGSLLLVRGLGIGIPYLSPKIDTLQQKIDCCHQH